MNTTHAFVEIIVSGVLALAAVLLFAAGILGVDGVSLIFTGPDYVSGAVLAVIAYSLGVVSFFAYMNLVNSYYKQLRLAAEFVLKMSLPSTRNQTS